MIKNFKSWISFGIINEGLSDKYEPIGNFDLESNRVIVSDPCYENTGNNILNNVIPGRWNAYSELQSSGEYDEPKELLAIKDGYENKIGNWIPAPFTVSVDSGIAGVYDEKYYGTEHKIDNVPIRKYVMEASWDYYEELMDQLDKEFGEKLSKEDIGRYNIRKAVLKANIIKNHVKKYEVCLSKNAIEDKWKSINHNLTYSVKNEVGLYDDVSEIKFQHAGCLPFGCVSLSGGDDYYECYYATEHGEKIFNDKDPFGEEQWDENLPIIAIKIVFND